MATLSQTLANRRAAIDVADVSGLGTAATTAATDYATAAQGTSANTAFSWGNHASAGYVSSDSPAFTGTPTAPTATAGTNTTQIATTAFVLANVPLAAPTSWVNQQVFTPGSYTFTVPEGIYFVRVQMWSGGGGGGGGTDGGSSGDPPQGACGGSFVQKIISVTPGEQFSVVSGAGGVAGASLGTIADDGGTGGTSSFGAVFSVLGGGGGIGNGSPTGSHTAQNTRVGTASGSYDLYFRGGYGGGGDSNENQRGGGGGGGAGTTQNGGDGEKSSSGNVSEGGLGGAALGGDGGGNASGFTSEGKDYGGGGQGGQSTGTGGTNGGVGGDGVVIVQVGG